MSKETDNLIESDNPIASLSHEQKIQFNSSRYLGDIKSARHNAMEAIRTSEFDIPKERDKGTVRINHLAGQPTGH